ncbi:MAG: hypothetical protein U9Q77_09525 [Candidatus Marinimicrobia bacterium]|nr:hypothetical protein [Candidatus Neomarinimicrobiota bacterium]
MLNKNKKIEEAVETEETEEAVDFDDSESRMKFLKSQLNDLLDGINNVYGQDLMEELLKRLEKTVEDYNTEVSGLISKLKDGKIFDEDEPVVDVQSKVESENGDAEASGKTFDEQEAEDSDIIARMRARASSD